jgi:hypothetical protein
MLSICTSGVLIFEIVITNLARHVLSRQIFNGSFLINNLRVRNERKVKSDYKILFDVSIPFTLIARDDILYCAIFFRGKYMKIFLLCIMAIFFSASLRADDVYLKNKTVLRNVKVLGDTLQFQSPAIKILYFGPIKASEQILIRSVIDRIEIIPVDLTMQSYRANADSVSIQEGKPRDKIAIIVDSLNRESQIEKILNRPQEPQFPNIEWLSVSALATIVSIDFFIRSSDYADQIDQFNSLKLDSGKLQKAKGRSVFFGVLSAGVAIISTIHAMERIEFSSDGKSIRVSVNL